MKVLVLVKASKDSEAGAMPGKELLNEMGKFNEELIAAGLLVAAEGLHPSSKGARVQFSGKNRTVVDGPFAETKELVAGYWIWQVKSMQEAIEWVKRCPNPMPEDSEIEIRPVFDAADFGDALTPELRQRDASMRAHAIGLSAPRFEDGGKLLIGGLNESYTFETRVNIPQQWHRFAPSIGKVPGQVGMNTYGVCWNYEPECGFDYLAGVEINSADALPKEFTTVTIEPQSYVIFPHYEHYTSIPKTIEAIWTKWLPESGYRAAQAPSFERYTEEFNPETGIGGTEIWIPLQA